MLWKFCLNNPKLTLVDENDDPIYHDNNDSCDSTISVKSRKKHFIFGVAALAVTTTAFGIYKTVQIEFPKHQLTEVKDNTWKLS